MENRICRDREGNERDLDSRTINTYSVNQAGGPYGRIPNSGSDHK